MAASDRMKRRLVGGQVHSSLSNQEKQLLGHACPYQMTDTVHDGERLTRAGGHGGHQVALALGNITLDRIPRALSFRSGPVSSYGLDSPPPSIATRTGLGATASAGAFIFLAHAHCSRASEAQRP